MKRLFVLMMFLFISCSRNVVTSEPVADPVAAEEIPLITDVPVATADSPLTPELVVAVEPQPDKVLIEGVPFTAQAPTGNWDDERYQDGCEEASIIMAMRWVHHETALSSDEALQEIADLTAYEVKNTGYHNDTNAADTAQLIRDYYKHEQVQSRSNVTAEDIRAELAKGNLVLVPLDGRKLNNPYYTQPGPERHKLVIIGYDKKKDVFITNDPGTRRGKEYRYPTAVLVNAILDYPSGNEVPLTDRTTAMVIVSRGS